ncbi:MAG: zf-HC2 domain-containing protein [Chloroflexota bacterium]
MTQKTNHIDERTLERYVAGQLSAAAADVVLSHLEACDDCLERVEALWATTDIGAAVAEATEEPNRSQKDKMEHLIVNRIHRSNLGGKLVEVGLGGFLDVVMALLRPLFGAPPKKRVRGEGYD